SQGVRAGRQGQASEPGPWSQDEAVGASRAPKRSAWVERVANDATRTKELQETHYRDDQKDGTNIL
ncbi:MAG: hypothetical protein J2P36_21580, partial [Ktedonobacteraceae bacterium]|nr:hypothetical protein [Ktedonobacteraceae bacterium]